VPAFTFPITFNIPLCRFTPFPDHPPPGAGPTIFPVKDTDPVVFMLILAKACPPMFVWLVIFAAMVAD
jgi:hypothetical protein